MGIVQAELDRFRRPRYLEIGINVGTLFLHVRASRKVGVDPAPRIPRWRRLLHPRTVATGRIVKRTSDQFFAELGEADRFEVVFVDGLHTFEQSLRDVEAALEHLVPAGVVLVHDCNPTSADLAAPTPRPGAGDGWCGDVWKTIVHLRATRRDLQVHVLDTDFGIGVIRRGPSSAPDVTPGPAGVLTYEDLHARRSELLGLRAVD